MQPLESWWHDLRVGIRHLTKTPGATGLSIISIALGIGLTAGIFSVADAMFLRPFAVERPTELMQVGSIGEDGRGLMYGWADCEDMVRVAPPGVALVAMDRRSAMLGNPGEERQLILTHYVTPNYFSVIGVPTQLGTPSVGEVDGRPGVVIGHQLWVRRFGGDPNIVGKTIVLSRKPFVVTAVMSPRFTGVVRGVLTDAWASTDAYFHVLGNADDERSREGEFEMVARVPPGVDLNRVAAMLDAAIRGEGKHKPAPPRMRGTYLQAGRFALTWKTGLLFTGGLLLILGSVLFVACANVAQLRLAQSESRRKELGVRMALGAGAWRITRQLVVETALVSIAGAALGVLLAQRLMIVVARFLSVGQAFIDYGIRLDLRVLLYVVGALLLSLIISGLSPARLALRMDVWDVITAEQGTTGRRGGWQKRLLVTAQIAVSVALIGCATLFVTSLRNAAAIHPGLDPQKKLLVMTVAPGQDDAAAWSEAICERLSSLPGVRAATFARRLPLSGSGGGLTAQVEIPGQTPVGVPLNNVGGNYFAAMGTRMVAGRAIDSSDRKGSQPVVVISRNFAGQLLGGREPLGQWVGVNGVKRQVVGIAEDGPSNYLHEPPSPYLFLPFAQAPSGDLTLMIETAGEPAALERAARQELKRFDSRAIVFTVWTLRQQLNEALAEDIMMASLSSALGFIGVLLTAAGLFGVLQYMVQRRTRELGLRMAMGARPAEIQRLILAESLRMSAWGVPVGLGLLWIASGYARTMVLGISPSDPRLYAFSAITVLGITLLAAWLPARRATRVDPMTALRSE